jgi:hypothetical protein
MIGCMLKCKSIFLALVAFFCGDLAQDRPPDALKKLVREIPPVE